LSVAQKAQAHLLICKARRHLAGIALKQGRFVEAKAHAEQVMDGLKGISERVKRTEMKASLDYLRARIAQREGDSACALKCLESAERGFARIHDHERAAKVHGARGEICLAIGAVTDAKDCFRLGIASANRVSRRDCLIANLVGLSEVARREGNPTEERALLDQAATVASETGDSDLAARLRQKASQVRTLNDLTA
jgi:tetratricopeptide (TPR) repeat protein